MPEKRFILCKSIPPDPLPLLKEGGIIERFGGVQPNIDMGSLRGAKPLFINISPSSCKERGTKGVRLFNKGLTSDIATLCPFSEGD